MKNEPRRIRREKRTVSVMIGMYCRDHHTDAGADTDAEALCEECQALHDYAMARIEKCPFSPEKPTCANCPIHCYRRARRDQVRDVMAYAGPRMMRRHPFLAILHVLDGFRRVERPRRRERDAA